MMPARDPAGSPRLIEVFKDGDPPVMFDFSGKPVDPGIQVTVP